MKLSGDIRRSFADTSGIMARIFAGMLLIAGSAFAQTTTGTIFGTVKDQSEAVLPGASVTVTNVDTGIARTASAGSRGEFRIPALAVGNYEVKAELAGFQTGVRRGVTLTIGREAVVDITLQVGDVSEKVTVTGEAPLVETTTATVGGVVDSQQMKDIPLNARSFIELVPLQAGAVLSDTGGQSSVFGFGKKLAVVGTRYTSNSFLLDGADINDSSSTSGSAAGTMAGVETVREFRVITNAYDAEYGRHTGGVISAITKSGTNSFHGSLFEFLRNDNFDARNFFDKEKPEFKRNQFGGSVGGPIVKDRTFFFGSYEGLRETLGLTKTIIVPGLAMRQQGILPTSAAVCAGVSGVFNAANGRCTIPIAPGVRPFLDSYPIGGPDRSDGTAQYIESSAQPTRQNFWTARVDHRMSDNDSLFFRFTKDDAERKLPVSGANGGAFNTSRQSPTGSRFSTLEDTHIFSPSLLGKSHVSFNRTSFGDVDIPRDNYTFPRVNFTGTTGTVGNLAVSGLSTWGGGTTTPRRNVQNIWQLKEEMTYAAGRHAMKFGAQYERFQYNIRGDFNGGGTFTFLNLPDFLANNVGSATFTKPGSDSFRTWVQSLYGFYMQDDFSVRPGLTVNLGLRYEFVTVPAERHGRSSTIRDLRGPHLNTVTPDTADIGPMFRNPSLKNVAPRVGFAWDVFGNGSTSIRGGAGMFHDQVLPIYYVVPGNRTSPFYAVAEMIAQDIKIDFPNAYTAQRDFLVRTGGRPQIDGIEYEISQPAVYKWSLDLEHQIAKNTSVQMGYAGTRGTHLMRGNLQLNTTPSEFRNGRRYILIDQPVNNPFFNRFRWRINDGTSIYHNFRTSVTKRFSGGFQVQGSYTYARAIDDGSAFLGSGDFTNDRQPYRNTKERALSAFDIRHSFNTNFVYDIPGRNLTGMAGTLLGGWSLSSILRFNTGAPQSVIGDQRRKGTLQMIYVDGPTVDLIPGGNLNPVRSRNPDAYFDVNQFALPDDFYQGNVGPNTVIGPGVANVDITLMKNTKIRKLGEAGGLEFRAEFFNLFNRANFADPASMNVFFNTGLRRSDAGQIRATRTTARQIQLALRLVF